jgi:hypothetical protein
MKQLLILLSLSLSFTMCSGDNEKVQAQAKTPAHQESEFKKEVNFFQDENGSVMIGEYIGYEFTDEGDVGHRFSNLMSSEVGYKLKTLYDEGLYYKVDLEKIHMSTIGMGSGTVNYSCVIPFVSVTEECDAMTSFDHCGGWGHTPALNSRKDELSDLLLKGDKLDISSLKTTPEGLEEYWIQWRNYKKQAECLQ